MLQWRKSDPRSGTGGGGGYIHISRGVDPGGGGRAAPPKKNIGANIFPPPPQ